MPAGTPRDPQPSLARVPYVLTMSSRRWHGETMPEAVVPYLRMSGRWLEEHGFVIGTTVQVLVEHGRVTLISEAVEEACKVRPNDGRPGARGGKILLLTHEHFDARTVHDRPQPDRHGGGD